MQGGRLFTVDLLTKTPRQVCHYLKQNFKQDFYVVLADFPGEVKLTEVSATDLTFYL